LDAASAALEAGFTRFRPVLMTALAMIIGMLPMAFALGEGGEQNAPLGRAVIGGLLVATVATLFFVPTVFSICMRAGIGGTRSPKLHEPKRLHGKLDNSDRINVAWHVLVLRIRLQVVARTHKFVSRCPVLGVNRTSS
jgi:hypothetical protein